MTIITKILMKLHRDEVKHAEHPHITPPPPEGLTQIRPGLDAYGQRRTMDLPKSKLSQNYPKL